jgi:hypothetical protein
MPRRIWTNRRKWLGNLIPLFLGVFVGLISIPLNLIIGCLLAIVATWVGINVWGFYENKKIEQELRFQTKSQGELIGFVHREPASGLDAHAEIGLLSFASDALEIITEDSSTVLPKEQIRGISRRLNVHSILLLGGWVVVSLPEGKELTLESRKFHTMLASRSRTKQLYKELKAWKQKEGSA